MDKSMIYGLVAGAAIATGGGIIASNTLFGDKEPTFAEVISVEEITETVETPREECEDVEVTKKVQPKDDKQIAGTAVGAVVGGLLGNQVGGGSGKTLATIAGAAAGGYAGNKVQESHQNKKTYTTTEQRCKTVTDTSENVVGYNVTYKIGSEQATVQMAEKPGKRIPLENGQLVLE